MRFLPYLLVGVMALPATIWFIINNFVVHGRATAFSPTDWYMVITLGAFMLTAFFLLSTWLDKQVRKTKR